MLIIKSLLLATAVLAAPIPFNAPLNDDALFSRASKGTNPPEGRQVFLEYVTWNLQWHHVPQVGLQRLFLIVSRLISTIISAVKKRRQPPSLFGDHAITIRSEYFVNN